MNWNPFNRTPSIETQILEELVEIRGLLESIRNDAKKVASTVSDDNHKYRAAVTIIHSNH